MVMEKSENYLLGKTALKKGAKLDLTPCFFMDAPEAHEALIPKPLEGLLSASGPI
jgi:hypothetical protein